MYLEIIDRMIAKCLKGIIDWQDKQHIKKIKKDLIMELSIEEQRELDRRDARKEGRREGFRAGRIKFHISLIIKKVKKGQSLEQIADALETSPEELKEMYHAVLAAAPDYDVKKIYQMIASRRKS